MEIKKIEIYELEVKLKQPFETSFGSVQYKPAILVRVEEKWGEEGWGEVAAGEGPWYNYETYETAFIALDKYLIPILLKTRTLNARDFWRLTSRVRGYNAAKAGLEAALWDLEARLKGVPLYKYIGGVKKRIPSGVSIGIKKNIEELLSTISKRLEEGYLRIKIKIKPGWDLEVVEKVREEFSDTPLQVDANAAYTLGDLYVLKKLDKYDLLMIEQPLHYEDFADHALLARKLSTPICLDESIRGIHDAKTAYLLGSAEIINVKPARVGGYTPSMEIHDFCGATGIGLWVGGMLETGVGKAHLLALASLKNFTYPNDISASSRYWEKDVIEPELEVRNGYIELREAAGIGFEILTDQVEKNSRKKSYSPG